MASHYVLFISTLVFIKHFIILCHSTSVKIESDPIVETPSGKLRGSILQTWTNNTFYAFRGIPFAEPPVGMLRFKVPVSIKPWSDIKDATNDGYICPQVNMDLVGKADEDCLNLNVYSRNLKGNYPVIVYFHPGAFFSMTGASNWNGPQYLMDQDIVLVTVNYRLDALGFLSTGDDNAHGNNGLKDQVEALKWVQKHIKSFGGNSEKVTIAGYSAGSTSCFLHMLSPMSKGLFHQVIAMSAGVTSDWVITKDPLKHAKTLANLFNCSTQSTKEIVDCLRKVPAREINDKFYQMRDFGWLPMVLFGPVIEPDLGDGTSFLTNDPVKLIKERQFHHVPVITGMTTNEFISWSIYTLNNETLSKRLINEFDKLAPRLFGYEELNQNDAAAVTNTFKELYLGNKPVSTKSVKELGQWYSDYSIIYGEYMTTRLLMKYNRKPIYTYILTYNGRYSHAVDPATNKTLGPAHHDDLIYLFYISKVFPKLTESDPEAFMVKSETSFWKNFATTGNPTPDASQIQWTPFTENNEKYFNFGVPMKMEHWSNSPFVERMKTWEKLFPVD